MNREAVGTTAELPGAIDVIATLADPVVQIRQNTTSMKASTALESGRLSSELHPRIAYSPARIWAKGLANEDAPTDEEKQSSSGSWLNSFSSCKV